MNLYSIETGNFKLDGGAMFGVVPKKLWQRTNPADENNLIDMASRSLLIEDGKRLILIDCGYGNKQDDKFFGHYSLWGNHNLDNSLNQHGFCKDDITDVFLTHLHFDHCGGAIEWNRDRTGYQPSFKNAIYWSNKAHWEWAVEKSNPREKASFLVENILPIKESGQLKFIDLPIINNPILTNSPLNFDILFVNGHTDKQMIPIIKYKAKTIVFTADLLPTVGHIPLVYIPALDTRPLLTMDEKQHFLTKAVTNDYLLFLYHDASNEMCTVKMTDKGFRLANTFSLNNVL